MAAVEQGPVLLSLNLQQTRLKTLSQGPVVGACLWRMRDCLAWARRDGLNIVHVHSGDPDVGAPSPPIRGFEPRHTETIIHKHDGAVFDAPEWQRSSASHCTDFLLIGLSRQGDVLATAVGARARGMRLLLVHDAVALGLGTPHDATATLEILEDLLQPFCAFVTAGDLGAGPPASKTRADPECGNG